MIDLPNLKTIELGGYSFSEYSKSVIEGKRNIV